jgi:hypothetical protein
MPVIPDTQGSRDNRFMSLSPTWANLTISYLKNKNKNRDKSAGDMAKMIKHLRIMYKTLGSIPSTIKINKQTNK